MRKNQRVKEENTYKTYRSKFFLQKIATNTNTYNFSDSQFHTDQLPRFKTKNSVHHVEKRI